MDIEQFYSADERRRQSSEVELGTNWFDARGHRYELSWVEDTGELYAMLEVLAGAESLTPFGDMEVEGLPVGAVVVQVLGTIPTLAEVETILAGWPDQMTRPDSIAWAVDRLRANGIEVAGSPDGE
jgi:hypothetical protein